MKKLCCAIFLAVFLFTFLIPLNAVDSSVWDGNTPNVTGGYTFAGAGNEADPYRITSATDLAALAALVNLGNSFDGKYFILTTDIDLACKNWASIGYAPLKDYNYISLNGATPFCGSFDGQHHIIRNLANTYSGSLTSAAPGYTYGLFGYIKGAVLKNFAVLDAKVEGYALIGIACGSAQSNTEADPTVLENIFVTGEVTSGFYNTGTLLGRGLGVNPEANKYTSDGSVKTGMFIRSCYSNAAFTMDTSRISPDTVNLFIGTILGCTTSNMVTATVNNSDNGCVVNSKNNSIYKINRSGYAGAVEISESDFNGLFNAFLTNSIYVSETTVVSKTTSPQTTATPVTTVPVTTAPVTTAPVTTAPIVTAATDTTTTVPVTTAKIVTSTIFEPIVTSDSGTGLPGQNNQIKTVLLVVFSLALVVAVIVLIVLKNNKVRIVCIVLAALMVAGIVISALAEGSPEGNGTETTLPEGTEIPQTTSPYDKNGYLLDQLPAGLNFNNTEISFLCWDGQSYPEFDTEINGDLINDAIYSRNQKTEERMGVDMKFSYTPGGSSDYEAYSTKATADIMSGTNEFDIYAAYSRTIATCAYKGLTQNLLDIEYLNFGNPWWPKTLIDSSTINNKLFFCTGDLSVSLFHNLDVIYFNKDIAAEIGAEGDTLYDLALSGKWTLEKFMEYSDKAYRDTNGDGKKDSGDRLGYAASNVQSQIIFWGSGIKAIDVSSGKLEVDESWTSEKMVDLLNRFFNWGNTSNSVMLNTSGNAPFQAGTLLFLSNIASYTMGAVAEANINFGILPPPKYNELQENYISVMGNAITLYALTTVLDSDESDMCGVVLECMGSEGYRQITPAIYETAMKYKYAKDDKTAQTYDLIRENIFYDHGRIYSGVLNNLFTGTYNNALKDYDTGWISRSKAVESELQGLIDSINSVFSKY